MASVQQSSQASQSIASNETAADTYFQGINSPSTLYEDNQEDAPATGEDANDSGFFDDEDSVAPGTNYKDFTLFPDSRSEVDVDKYQLFADLDASTGEQVAPFESNSGNDSGVEFDNDVPNQQLSTQAEDYLCADALYDDILGTKNQAVFEAIKDYPAPVSTAVDPFQSWLATYHRHECLLYNLEQQAHVECDSEQQ